MDSASLHSLLLLSDSALPLGSFAFSSGLESYLAHHKQKTTATSARATTAASAEEFDAFLELSLQNLASTSLPYVLDAFHNPAHLLQLDNDMDASTPCTVARRASVAQGKALASLWERALAPPATTPTATTAAAAPAPAFQQPTAPSIAAVDSLIAGLKASPARQHDTAALAVDVQQQQQQQVNGHFAPLFGAVCAALGLAADATAYLFLLNHAKAVLSAAVRASVFGPYQAHAVLAGAALQARIRACVGRERATAVRDAGLTVPAMDLWLGRHELLYSRIFNS
ncbi:hypothetical protein MBLNU459_g5444t1 [Dothideomycetes sp. NU459]